MKLRSLLIAFAIPVLTASAAPTSDGGQPHVEVPKKHEVDQIYFIQGEMTFPPPIGTVQVDVKITTCKQGTSGCP